MQPNEANPRPQSCLRGPTVIPSFISDLEDPRGFKQLYGRLTEDYPPKTIQNELDLSTLSRLNWKSERIDSLVEADLNHRLRSPILRRIQNPSLRLFRANCRALARREHQLLIKQNEANLRSIHTLLSRVEKWNPSR
jgi:hypothetical protein